MNRKLCVRRHRLVTAGFILLMITVCPPKTFGQTGGAGDRFFQLLDLYDRLNRSGKIDEAAQAAEQLFALKQRGLPQRYHYNATFFLAEIRGLQGRYKEAIELHELVEQELAGVTPRNAAERKAAITVLGSSYGLIGANYQKLGQYEKAVTYLERQLQWYQRFDEPFLGSVTGHAMMMLATGYKQVEQKDKALKLYREAAQWLEPLARRESRPFSATQSLAYTLHLWGEMEMFQARFDVAEPMLRRALELKTRVDGWKHPTTPEFLGTLAQFYGMQKRFNEEEQYSRAALELTESIYGENNPKTIDALKGLARCLRDQDRKEEAETMYRRVVDAYESRFGADHVRTARAKSSLATTLWRPGKYAEAERLELEALAFFEKNLGPMHDQTVESLMLLATLQYLQGKPDQIFRFTDRLEQILEVKPLRPAIEQNVRKIRAIALWQSGKKQAALAEMETALELVELQRSHVSGAERERASYFENYSAEYWTAVGWQAEEGNVAEVFRAVERIKARSFADELRLRNVDLLAGLPESKRDELLKREQELRRRLTEAERAYFALPELGPNPAADVIAERKELARAVRQARAELYQHLTDMRSASPAYRDLITQQASIPSIADLQQQFHEGELLLSYSLSLNRSFVVVVTRDSAEIAEIQVDDRAAEAFGIPAGKANVNSLRQVLLDEENGILPIISSARHQENASDKLAALWRVLIPESSRSAILNGEVTKLIIVPDGPLALLPFEALIVKNDFSPQYLLDVGPPIAYAPSAAVLINLASRESFDAARQKLFTLGDPAYAPADAPAQDAVDQRLGVSRADDRYRAGLSRLPYTGWESTWVQQMFDKAGLTTVQVTGAAATEAAIRQQAPGREIVHLACHGMADQNYGNFFGSLAVAPGRANDPNDDGFLSMSEIYQLDLTGCELAILSACETNYGPQQQGEGVWALSRGFLIAGSRRVVASNWVVDDQAGATLVSYFASYLTRAGTDASARDYATALHNAKKHVRKEEKWSHPFYWSSLVLVGPN